MIQIDNYIEGIEHDIKCHTYDYCLYEKDAAFVAVEVVAENKAFAVVDDTVAGTNLFAVAVVGSGFFALLVVDGFHWQYNVGLG